MHTLGDFATKWCHPDYPPDRVNEAALDAAELALNARFPHSYREAVLSVGLPSPRVALLNSIVDNAVDLDDISLFFAPNEIVERTAAWQGLGFPQEMFAFASDCMGNLFAFLSRGADEGPVYFFDHDLAETKLLANSFAEWIDAYASVPDVSPDD